MYDLHVGSIDAGHHKYITAYAVYVTDSTHFFILEQEGEFERRGWVAIGDTTHDDDLTFSHNFR